MRRGQQADSGDRPDGCNAVAAGLGRAVGCLGLAAAAALVASPARAVDLGFAVHAEGAAARMFGPRKVDEFGWGGAGLVAPELTVGPYVGVELPVGGMGLSDGAVDEPGMVDTGDGSAFILTPGVRVRPFGREATDSAFQSAGLWLAASGGLAQTGPLSRFAFSARVGYDLSAGPFRVGPYGGLLQIVETESEVRPEDARIALLGLHGSFEPGIEPEASVVDRDRDDDGIVDRLDGCPDDPEDIDGFEDQDGCPDDDDDGDGIRDADDRCRLIPEDFDGFEDTDGCPDYDEDTAGGANIADACPEDPETINGYADDDGCPDELQVRVVGNEIHLDERVYFRVNSADVLPRSWLLLGRVAKLLQANPQYVRVRVQGHADDTGDEQYNQQLSERRSASVRQMLARFGVADGRLFSEGYGEQRPAQPGTDPSARTKNRRVEFLIVERRTERVGTDGSTSSAEPGTSPGEPAPAPEPTAPEEQP